MILVIPDRPKSAVCSAWTLTHRQVPNLHAAQLCGTHCWPTTDTDRHTPRATLMLAVDTAVAAAVATASVAAPMAVAVADL
jgi:hypothetical protein